MARGRELQVGISANINYGHHRKNKNRKQEFHPVSTKILRKTGSCLTPVKGIIRVIKRESKESRKKNENEVNGFSFFFFNLLDGWWVFALLTMVWCDYKWLSVTYIDYHTLLAK